MQTKEQASKMKDDELVALALKDSGEFIHLMRRYERPLARYLKRLINAGPEDLEDLLQNIFIKVYANLNEFESDLSFSSWIYRIAHNEAIDHIRKLNRRPIKAVQNLSEDEDDNELDRIAAEFDLSAEADKIYLRKNIDRILDKLDPKYRSVLVLKFLEDKDYNEISDILKKPLGTVGTLINRAKKQFKEKAVELGIRIEHL